MRTAIANCFSRTRTRSARAALHALRRRAAKDREAHGQRTHSTEDGALAGRLFYLRELRPAFLARHSLAPHPEHPRENPIALHRDYFACGVASPASRPSAQLMPPRMCF